jgi:hypothetical protein
MDCIGKIASDPAPKKPAVVSFVGTQRYPRKEEGVRGSLYNEQIRFLSLLSPYQRRVDFSRQNWLQMFRNDPQNPYPLLKGGAYLEQVTDEMAAWCGSH